MPAGFDVAATAMAGIAARGSDRENDPVTFFVATRGLQTVATLAASAQPPGAAVTATRIRPAWKTISPR